MQTTTSIALTMIAIVNSSSFGLLTLKEQRSPSVAPERSTCGQSKRNATRLGKLQSRVFLLGHFCSAPFRPMTNPSLYPTTSHHQMHQTQELHSSEDKLIVEFVQTYRAQLRLHKAWPEAVQQCVAQPHKQILNGDGFTVCSEYYRTINILLV